jgi:cytidine deaminase
MKLTRKLIRGLVERAMEAREHAYAPYSRFHVGAALLASDGAVYIGCNVENSSFGATCCAERTALFAAVADGRRDFAAVAIAADTPRTAPCGICRQALAEFHPALPVILTDGDGGYLLCSLAELLPEPFLPDALPHAES